MKTIDLSHLIAPDMPVYPGTEKPLIVEATTIEKEGFAEKCLTFYSHTGTHMDAPGHIIPGRHTLDQFGVDKFLGKALIVDVAEKSGKKIEKAFLQSFAGAIEGADFVLFRSGWDSNWGKEEYFSDFPVLSREAAEWLCRFKLKGVGVDCISVDPVGVEDMEIHKLLLGSDLVIIENLRNLGALGDSPFIFSALPLKIENSDGSPVRAVGIIL